MKAVVNTLLTLLLVLSMSAFALAAWATFQNRTDHEAYTFKAGGRTCIVNIDRGTQAMVCVGSGI
ncbi:hypothetical protein [uncultured Pseudomonas sp.]|uniref:hypothetical protein n=1 Tax=uncultured Pseudomonas sp. TaxID=114707 RepID=UPI0025CD5067|nr:hypothetical protein [uncultured Pseudomonas sp.]